MCNTTILVQKGNISITECRNCKVLNIWRAGVLMNFSFSQFDAFNHSTQKLNFDDYLETAPNGNEIVILSTPFPDISLVFTRDEWEIFFAAIQEAVYMQQIYSLVHG